MNVYPTDVFVVDAATGAATLASPGPPGRYAAVDWSPDGSRLAIVHDHRIVVARADGSRPVPVYNAGEQRLFDVQWTPDGATLITGDDGTNVRLVSADGSGNRATGHQGFMFDWAPGGRIVMDWHDPESTAPSEYVKVVQPDGSSRVISKQLAASPRWSGDGRVVYHHPSANRSDGTAIISAAADGSSERALVSLPPPGGTGPILYPPFALQASHLVTFRVEMQQSLSGAG